MIRTEEQANVLSPLRKWPPSLVAPVTFNLKDIFREKHSSAAWRNGSVPHSGRALSSQPKGCGIYRVDPTNLSHAPGNVGTGSEQDFLAEKGRSGQRKLYYTTY
jgi:hypothetical protein